MRGSFISALTLMLSACVVTGSGTKEAVLFSDKEASTEHPQAVLKPYNDLPLLIGFSCPQKLITAMTSFVVPLPPIIPVGMVNDHVSYLRIRLPEDAKDTIERIRIFTPQGGTIPLRDVWEYKLAVPDRTLEVAYVLKSDCEAFNGAVLEVAGFSYKNKKYPASETRLQFESRIKNVLGFSITDFFKDEERRPEGFDALRTPEQ